MTFECVMENGEMFFKDEHGLAELLLRKEKKVHDIPGKRSKKEVVNLLTMRCPNCGRYQEVKMVGIL